MDKLCLEIPQRTHLVALAICLLGERINYLHEGSIRAMTNKALQDINELSLKDFEQTCFLYIKYGIQPDFVEAHNLCRRFLEQIPRRSDDIITSARRLIPLLYCLAILGHYDVQLINNALRKDFLAAVHPHYSMYPVEVYGLDAFVKINLRDTYTGNRLEGKEAMSVVKAVMSYIPEKNGKFKVRGTDVMLLDLNDVVRELHQHCYMGHAIPQSGYAGTVNVIYS